MKAPVHLAARLLYHVTTLTPDFTHRIPDDFSSYARNYLGVAWKTGSMVTPFCNTDFDDKSGSLLESIRRLNGNGLLKSR